MGMDQYLWKYHFGWGLFTSILTQLCIDVNKKGVSNGFDTLPNKKNKSCGSLGLKNLSMSTACCTSKGDCYEWWRYVYQKVKITNKKIGLNLDTCTLQEYSNNRIYLCWIRCSYHYLNAKHVYILLFIRRCHLYPKILCTNQFQHHQTNSLVEIPISWISMVHLLWLNLHVWWYPSHIYNVYIYIHYISI